MELTGHVLKDAIRYKHIRACRPCRNALAEQADREEQESARAEVLARVERSKAAANLPEKMRGLHFDTLEEDWQQKKAYHTVKAWAEGFPKDAHGYPSLILYSPSPGTGKTTLATCAANEIITRLDGIASVRYESGPGLGVRVRSTYNGGDEHEADVYRHLAGVKLLILDDIGDDEKEKPSDASRRMYFTLIDERYQSGLPVIVVTNASDKELGRFLGTYTLDRLMEMSGNTFTRVTGMSRQERIARGPGNAL